MFYMMENPLFLRDEAATRALAVSAAEAMLDCAKDIDEYGLVVYLEGELGAGKTTFARELLRRMGVAGRVKSPTFSLVESYEVKTLPFYLHHFDFYRFSSPEEFADAGFAEDFGKGRLCLCEWPAKATGFVPAADVVVSLEILPEGRSANISGFTPLGERIVEGVLA